MEIEEILMELKESERDGGLDIFRKLIKCGSTPRTKQEKRIIRERESAWEPIFVEFLQILAKNRDRGKEQILLIPHAFLVLLYNQYELDEFKSIVQRYLQLDTNRLHSFDTYYNIHDIDLFKLLITYGYLQVNRKEIYIEEICETSFRVLYENCIRYTRHTYLAYKILHTWLQRTSNTDFWEKSNPCLEKKLETIIYSNWNNSIKEISKQNSTLIFNQYLRIMDRKYANFLAFAFKDCIDNVSWMSETKYVILSEICDVWNNIEAFIEREFILHMFTSLTKSDLLCSGTKLYNAILTKLSVERWKDAFGYPISRTIHRWGSSSRKNHQALHLLCSHWLEPTIKKHRSILPFLWELSNAVPDLLFRSHLERIASQTGVTLQGGTVRTLIDHYDEYLRLNSFATHCQKQIRLENNDLRNQFLIVERFLFYNATSSSTYLRRGIIKYSKIFFLNLFKSCDAENYYNDRVFYIFHWLHEFLFDCFEIGSCYQRKVLGIKLYEMILFYTNERAMSDDTKNDPRYRDDLNNGFKMRRRLKNFGEWKLTNKIALLWLIKLILDPATDVREASATIILEHFPNASLNDSEKKVLLDTAIKKCNSAKFYETESGSMLMRILLNWLPFEEAIATKETEFLTAETRRFYKSLTTHTKYIEYLLDEARNQLARIRHDILRAAMQNSPFHGVLTAILNVGFRNKSKTELITVQFIENLLELLENGVAFFLSILSSKSSECEFSSSSSFAEMGLAIDKTVKDSEIGDEYDDIVLSPAHQLVITCIWISLKVSCELAGEIAMLTYSYETVKRSAGLITLVLTKCRHKGAIEAAGIAIGRLTGKLVNTDGYGKLPEEWLIELTSGHETNPNLTRRSAGLSIMFHRIVANDNRRNKPLVHIAIENLLNLLENTPESCKFEEGIVASVASIEDKNQSYQDLPRAKHLHFLQRLVADSDLHAQVVPYLERITMQCFKNLQSQIWTVRNASLQLFGAIVPRIAGQYNGGHALDFGTGCSIDHFIIHYSVLAEHIYSELKSAASWDNCLDATLKSHSAIVPSVILLSRMSTGGSDFIDYSSKVYILSVKQNLKLLFGSPIGNVRILASKAYAALVSFPEITSEYKELKEAVQNVEDPNYAHGYLCAIKYLDEKFKMESKIPYYRDNRWTSRESIDRIQSQPTVDRMADRISIEDSQNSHYVTVTENETENISRAARVKQFWNKLYSSKFEFNLCYIVEAMSLIVFQNLDRSPTIFLFKEIGQESDIVLSTQTSKPGFGEFIDTSTYLYVNYINHSDNIDEETIKRILYSQCTDQSVNMLKNLKYDVPVHDIILNYILRMFHDCDEALLDAMVRYLNESLKNFFLIRDKESTQHFPKSLANGDEIKRKVYRLAAMIKEDRKYWKLELFCYILINVLDYDSESIDAIARYCCDKIVDDDEVVRKSVAECLPCLLLHFEKMENCNKLKTFKLCLELLKDEVSEIRESARVSIINYSKNMLLVYATPPLSEIIYNDILDKIFINNKDYADFSMIEIVQFLIDRLASINCMKSFKTIVESPFDHQDDATSAEETKLLNVIFYRVSRLAETKNLENDLHLGNDMYSSNCDNAIRAKNRIQERARIDFCDLKTILDLGYNDYMVAKRDVVLEFCSTIPRIEERFFQSSNTKSKEK